MNLIELNGDYPPNMSPIEQIVGVPLKSYVSASWTYYFNRE